MQFCTDTRESYAVIYESVERFGDEGSYNGHGDDSTNARTRKYERAVRQHAGFHGDPSKRVRKHTVGYDYPECADGDSPAGYRDARATSHYGYDGNTRT